MEDLRHHPLDIVTACRAADLPILRLTVAALRRHVPVRQVLVITARGNFEKFGRVLGSEVELIDEDTFIPGMTISELRALPLAGFPLGAGWYFQQLLKFNYCFSRPEDDYYLIWDADTIPLQDLQFFDERGRMLFTIGEEEHVPYFETYRNLLGEDPHREFSFITQHIVVQKSLLREMLARIDSRLPGSESWAWKIMRNLKGEGTNLFSEYEMFGHYAKNHAPDRAAYRHLPWLRDGSRVTNGTPSGRELERLGKDHAFAAFESSQMPMRRFVRWLRSVLGR